MELDDFKLACRWCAQAARDFRVCGSALMPTVDNNMDFIVQHLQYELQHQNMREAFIAWRDL